MPLFKIRLKRFPDKYVGKTNPTYAIATDQYLKERPDVGLQADAHWFVAEKRAKIWSSERDLKRFLGYCRDSDKDTFSEFELVIVRPSGISIIDLVYQQELITSGKPDVVKQIGVMIKESGMQSILGALISNLKEIQKDDKAEYIEILEEDIAAALKTYKARYEEGKAKE